MTPAKFPFVAECYQKTSMRADVFLRRGENPDPKSSKQLLFTKWRSAAKENSRSADKCCNNIVSDNHISPLYFRSVVAEKSRECNKGEPFIYLQTIGRRSESSARLLGDQLALFFRGIPPKINTTTLCACSIICVLLCVHASFHYLEHNFACLLDLS